MMKNKENIDRWEAMTDEELLSLAESSEVEAPRELSGKLDSMLRSLEAQDRRRIKLQQYRRASMYAFASLGLVAACIAAVLIFRLPSTQPEDTFSSPEEAYAMLESTFSHISSKTGAATLALGGSMRRAENTIKEIYR